MRPLRSNFRADARSAPARRVEHTRFSSAYADRHATLGLDCRNCCRLAGQCRAASDRGWQHAGPSVISGDVHICDKLEATAACSHGRWRSGWSQARRLGEGRRRSRPRYNASIMLVIRSSLRGTRRSRIWTTVGRLVGGSRDWKVRVPNKPLISIVDDDEAVREATKGLMRALGFLAETFGSAEDFLNFG